MARCCCCCRVGEPFVDPWGGERVLTQDDIDRGALADGTPIAATVDGWTVVFRGPDTKHPAAILTPEEDILWHDPEAPFSDRRWLADILRPREGLAPFLRRLALHIDVDTLLMADFVGHTLQRFVDAPFALCVGLETRYARLPLVMFRSDRPQNLPRGARIIEWETTLCRNALILAALAELRLSWREFFWGMFTGHFMGRMMDAEPEDEKFFARANARAFANLASAVAKTLAIAGPYEAAEAGLRDAVARAVNVVNWRMLDLLRAYGAEEEGLALDPDGTLQFRGWSGAIQLAARPDGMAPYEAMALMPERAVYCVASEALLGEYARSIEHLRAFLTRPPQPFANMEGMDAALVIAAFRLALGMNVRFEMAFWAYGPFRDYTDPLWFARPGVTAVFPAVPFSIEIAVLLMDAQNVSRFIEGEFEFAKDLVLGEGTTRSEIILRSVAAFEEAASRHEAPNVIETPALEKTIVNSVYAMRSRWIANRHIMECAKEAIFVRYVVAHRTLTLRSLYDEYCVLMHIVRIDQVRRDRHAAAGEPIELYVPQNAARVVFHEVIAALLDLMLCSKAVQQEFMNNDEEQPTPEREFLARLPLNDAWIRSGVAGARFAGDADAVEAYNRLFYSAHFEEPRLVALG